MPQRPARKRYLDGLESKASAALGSSQTSGVFQRVSAKKPLLTFVPAFTTGHFDQTSLKGLNQQGALWSSAREKPSIAKAKFTPKTGRDVSDQNRSVAVTPLPVPAAPHPGKACPGT